ncbi:c-type cytochrome biogenesis protein CcmI [Vibrio algicola]|uniref:C-type cytochrome biogenesis protein CcmI n=1 Tax=Vibrio algicola TaxID=2662262 RepID=A0A5Q0TD33_9VIBR|nr:c-type cytochrome biogenesis protein CcmI [Vibrio algicola]
MIVFWICTVVLLAVSALFIIYPLLKPSNVDEAAQRDDLNKAFFKDRLNELESEDSAGIIEDKDELVTDLKQSLLDDIPNADKNAAAGHQKVKWMAIPMVLFMVVLTYGMYMLFGAHDQVSHWEKVQHSLPELTQKLMDPKGAELTDQQMNDLTLAMRTRLQTRPDDGTGWVLLGRIALSNRDVETAVGALTKADKLLPNNSDIQLSLAQALMFSSEQADVEKSGRILNQLLKQPDVDPRVYSLMAFNAYENGQFAQAIQYWRELQAKIGKDDSRYAMLERSIQTAQREMGATAQQQNAAQQVQHEGTPVSVTISLSPEATMPKTGVLIVSIHSADGSPMPIAAARYPLSKFPVTVVLDDSNSMMKQRKLSSLSDIMVRARIDTDGDVSTRDHDWHGESLPVHLGDDVVLSLDKQY